MAEPSETGAVVHSFTPGTLEEMHAMAGLSFLGEAQSSKTPCRRGCEPAVTDTDIDVCANRDMLTNPAIPLEDADDSYTPHTLEGMIEMANQAPKRERLRFFHLPREIRDEVYSHLLTPEGGFAMDFASCADCVHEVFDVKNDTHEDPDEPFVGRAWFAHEWRAIRRRLQNSIVSHQFHIEASTVFFSQPFRFTGDCGWITLYHFLDRLGHKQRCRLLNISVCHPGFASLPEVNPDRQLNWQGLVGLTGDYHDLFDGHMNAFGFGPALRQPYPPLSEDDAWKDRGHFDGTACLLADCSSLTRLTLTLPQFQVPPEQATFRDLGLHPIHSYRWPQGPALQRSVVHLVCSHHSCSDPERLQPCMAEIYEKSSEKQVFQDTSMLRLPLGYRPVTPHTAVRSQEARQFFDTVEREGWVVKQLLYDLRGHYPVAEGSLCVNMKMCRLLRSIDEPNLWYECPGNKYEALEHLEPGHWIFWWMGEEL